MILSHEQVLLCDFKPRLLDKRIEKTQRSKTVWKTDVASNIDHLAVDDLLSNDNTIGLEKSFVLDFEPAFGIVSFIIISCMEGFSLRSTVLAQARTE